MMEWQVRKTRASPVKPVRPSMEEDEAALLAAAAATNNVMDDAVEEMMIQAPAGHAEV
jgi:hypothetical protein